MWGAIIGDIVGSRFEFNNIKTKYFYMFDKRCRFTDDSVMTLAVYQALKDCNGGYASLSARAVARMREFGKRYPYCGFGGKFRKWLFGEDLKPYNSYGNGSAMRVSAVAYFADSIEQVKKLSYDVTAVTHNHPEGLKGAEATAVAVYLARCGQSKEEIARYVSDNYYPLNFTLDEIRPSYAFDVTCQGTVPQAIKAFVESEDFEDAVRLAISIGGDSDTLGAICGSIAEAYYGVPQQLVDQAKTYLDEFLLSVLKAN